MTEKDYIAIAEAIKDSTIQSVAGTTISKTGLLVALERVFQADNPNFQAGKFIKACG